MRPKVDFLKPSQKEIDGVWCGAVDNRLGVRTHSEKLVSSPRRELFMMDVRAGLIKTVKC
jgi:hypothetical protein